MRINRLFLMLLLSSLVAFGFVACKVNFSLSGASISPLAQTVSVAYIPNNAAMVTPVLSSTLRDALQDRFMRQTRLSLVKEGGDLNFEGEITGYMSAPSSISSEEHAQKNRLTITVKMKFTSTIEPQYNYNKTFSQFMDYDSNQLLQSVEPTLIPQIVDMLVEDIFNAAVSNW